MMTLDDAVIINMLGVCHPDNECNCPLVTLVSADQCPESRSPRYPSSKGLCTFYQNISRMFTLTYKQQSVLILNINRVITPVL